MKHIKPIQTLIAAQKVRLGPEILDQPLLHPKIENLDPFLLIQHGDLPIPSGQKQEDLGVPPHPHRGFSPVTFVFKGTVAHRDSLGNIAEVGPGGTQWMHAGRGIIHSERPGAELAIKGGENEFIQFWVNSPAQHKMDEPYYRPIANNETPKLVENGIEIAVVAGEYANLKGAATTLSPQILLRLEAQKGGTTTIEIPESYNCLLYLLNGALQVNGQKVSGREMLIFERSGTQIELRAQADTRAILLSGEPLNEAIVSYGPFVMSSQTEILQALSDSQSQKMGVLVESF